MSAKTAAGRLGRLTMRWKQEGRRPLVPFLTAGFPDETIFDGLLGAAAAAGCRLIELGIPFSDPVADGPVIQAASQHVLDRGMTLGRTLELAARAHETHGLEVVLMGYLNPLLKLGPDAFADRCGDAGVAGVIVPDLPPEEAVGLRRLLAAHDVDLVDLIAPTTDPDRLARNVAQARGFLYLVSTTGVTGAGMGADEALAAYVTRVREATDLPLYVGFGISAPAQAARVAAVADGAIVGSALLKTVTEAGADAVGAATTFLSGMVEAMQAARGSSR
jgi:tryptophan synthase alpha chain